MGSLCSSPAIEQTSEPVATDEPIQIKEEEKEPKEAAPKSTICVVACRGLRNADWGWVPGSAGGTSDAYVICKEKKGPEDAQVEKTLLQTTTIPNCLEPMFNEEFEVDIAPDSILEFTVYDHDPLKSDDVLGRAELQSADVANGYNSELELTGAGQNIKAYIKLLVKAPGGDYPPGPATEFQITLHQDKKKSLGFEIDKTSADILYVANIQNAGPAKECNDTVTADKQMKSGQYIVKVNGIEGDSKKMADELANANQVELSMVRPHVFTVAVAKAKGKSLGLRLSSSKDGVNVITQVDPGLISEWNKMYPDKEVKAGDRIFAVNGNRALGGKDQMKVLKADGPLQILISRRCPPAGTQGLLHGFWDWF